MTQLGELYRGVKRLEPLAASLALRHLQRSPSQSVDLRFALYPALVRQATGASVIEPEIWAAFQRGLEIPPTSQTSIAVQQALTFSVACDWYNNPKSRTVKPVR